MKIAKGFVKLTIAYNAWGTISLSNDFSYILVIRNMKIKFLNTYKFHNPVDRLLLSTVEVERLWLCPSSILVFAFYERNVSSFLQGSQTHADLRRNYTRSKPSLGANASSFQ